MSTEPLPTFSYSEVGATRGLGVLPGSMRVLRVRRRIGPRSDFAAAAEVVLSLGMHRGSGLAVRPPDAVVRRHGSFDLVLRAGPLQLAAPVAVVYVVEEPDRRGFAYGTLAGHPECGEEAFLVERDHDSTWMEVRAFSRPGRWFTRLAGPIGRIAQRRMAMRYIEAVERSIRPASVTEIGRGRIRSGRIRSGEPGS